MDCRTLSLAEVGTRLGRSRSWMYANLAKLKRLGFPAPLPVINRYTTITIDAWLDRQGQVVGAAKLYLEKKSLDDAFNIG